ASGSGSRTGRTGAGDRPRRSAGGRSGRAARPRQARTDSMPPGGRAHGVGEERREGRRPRVKTMRIVNRSAPDASLGGNPFVTERTTKPSGRTTGESSSRDDRRFTMPRTHSPGTDEVRLATLIRNQTARLAVVGQGYVGLPLAVEFARAGFSVTGLETDPERVAASGSIAHMSATWPAKRSGASAAKGATAPPRTFPC